MNDNLLTIREQPQLDEGVLMLAFSGWMDGGEVSTGTVDRLIHLLEARPVAEIDSDPFYIYNFPGSMEVAAMFRPHIEIEDGLIKSVDMPDNVFYHAPQQNLLLFSGTEPNLRWREFGDILFDFAHRCGVRRMIFVGSFGGSVPHTREPRLHITCSEEALLKEMEAYGVRRTGYAGPGSFTSYLMTQSPGQGLQMMTLVAEIPGYLQGLNPLSIEAVSRRLSKILQLPLELDSLRSASTEWELRISSLVDQDDELASKVRKLEEEYDNDLLERDS